MTRYKFSSRCNFKHIIKIKNKVITTHSNVTAGLFAVALKRSGTGCTLARDRLERALKGRLKIRHHVLWARVACCAPNLSDDCLIKRPLTVFHQRHNSMEGMALDGTV